MGTSRGIASPRTTEASDELTPALEPERRVIARRYGEVIDGMYAAARAAHAGG